MCIIIGIKNEIEINKSDCATFMQIPICRHLFFILETMDHRMHLHIILYNSSFKA